MTELRYVWVIVHDHGLNGAEVDPVGYATEDEAESARPAQEKERRRYTGYQSGQVTPVRLP